jgi:hypothetical protein
VTADAEPRLSRRGRCTLIAIALGIAAVFTGANAHLVYVSLATQPDCVPHLKAPDGSGTAFRAAKPSC